MRKLGHYQVPIAVSYEGWPRIEGDSNYVNWQNLLRQTEAATSACYEDSVDLTVMSCPDNIALVGWLQRMQIQNHISNVISAEVFHTALECTKLEAAEAESDWPCPALLPDAQVL